MSESKIVIPTEDEIAKYGNGPARPSLKQIPLTSDLTERVIATMKAEGFKGNLKERIRFLHSLASGKKVNDEAATGTTDFRHYSSPHAHATEIVAAAIEVSKHIFHEDEGLRGIPLMKFRIAADENLTIKATTVPPQTEAGSNPAFTGTLLTSENRTIYVSGVKNGTPLRSLGSGDLVIGPFEAEFIRRFSEDKTEQAVGHFDHDLLAEDDIYEPTHYAVSCLHATAYAASLSPVFNGSTGIIIHTVRDLRMSRFAALIDPTAIIRSTLQAEGQTRGGHKIVEISTQLRSRLGAEPSTTISLIPLS